MKNELLAYFEENPVRLTYNFKRIQTRFQLTEEEIREVKKQVSQGEQDDEYEVKCKWVKNDKESTLLVKKNPDINYKDEFDKFIQGYQIPQLNRNHNYEQGSKLAVVCMFDVHLGKIAHFNYTGNADYPLIQEESFNKEFGKLLGYLKTQDVEEILLPIGNDFFNVDDTRLTTKKGTPQDSSSNLAGVYSLGLDLICSTIDSLLEIAPVRVALVPGNHAPTVETYLATSVKKVFEGVHNVVIDADPTPRKYIRYGKNLIGLAHGELNPSRYVDLLPYEAKEHFSSCSHYEVLIGDKHIEESVKRTVTEHDGVVVRRLAALTKVDQWHELQGYSLSKRRSYVLLYDKEGGLETQYTNYAL
jgi:hypothetical protein